MYSKEEKCVVHWVMQKTIICKQVVIHWFISWVVQNIAWSRSCSGWQHTEFYWVQFLIKIGITSYCLICEPFKVAEELLFLKAFCPLCFSEPTAVEKISLWCIHFKYKELNTEEYIEIYMSLMYLPFSYWSFSLFYYSYKTLTPKVQTFNP